MVSPTDPNRVLASAYDGIYRSTNGGANWTRVLISGTDWIEFDPKNPGYVAALGVFGRVMRSTDNGDTWDPFFGAELQVAGNATFAFDRQVAGRMIVASSNGAYLSTDGGLYFDLRVTGLRAAYIGDFSTADDGTVYAVFNPGAGGVFRRDPLTFEWSALNNDDLKQKASTNGFLMSLVGHRAQQCVADLCRRVASQPFAFHRWRQQLADAPSRVSRDQSCHKHLRPRGGSGR